MADQTDPQYEGWFEKKWRPAMAYTYMAVVLFDFIIAPTAWTVAQFYSHGAGQVAEEWKPLTLIGGGLFHVAMGAVLGITSYGRTREKLNDGISGLNGNGNGDNQQK